MKNSVHAAQKFSIYGILLTIIQGLLLLCSGGFFEICIILCGLAFLFLLFRKTDLMIEKYHFLFLIFSLWYFFCSIKSGFITEYAIRGLIPLISFLIMIYIRSIRNQAEKILDIIVEISVWISVIAIIRCIASTIDHSALVRITFPFDYSNTSGIYFAVCCFYAHNSKSKFLNRCKYIFLIALLLTQSVGAIGIFVATMCIKLIANKKYVHTLILFLGVLVFAIILKGRVLESLGTFLERLLHIYDGIVCMINNPIFGIGAGQWENAKHYYQSGFYDAKIIHSSMISIGVNSGIVGFFLCLVSFYFAIKSSVEQKSMLIPAAMILIHSALDFSLSYMAINIMLILFLECKTAPKDSHQSAVGTKYTNIFLPALSLVFMFFLIGNCVSLSYTNKIRNMRAQEAASKYENNFFLKSSIRSSQCCAALLYTEKEKTQINFKHFKYTPTELLLYETFKKEGASHLLAALNKQPYNMAIMDMIEQNCEEPVLSEAKTIVNKALSNASVLGKKIYYYKGEIS